jgi:hypothetical protein
MTGPLHTEFINDAKALATRAIKRIFESASNP